MLSRDEATLRAVEHLREIEVQVGEELELEADKTLAEPFGWVFFYNTRVYLESRRAIDRLAGNAPFIVDMATGAITETGTGRPWKDYI